MCSNSTAVSGKFLYLTRYLFTFVDQPSEENILLDSYNLILSDISTSQFPGKPSFVQRRVPKMKEIQFEPRSDPESESRF